MNKKLIILLLFLVFVLNFNVSALDPVTEDSWIGAYFIKQSTLSGREKLYPFLDIRQSNMNQKDISSNFKWIIANSILANNLKTYKLMQKRNIDLDELYKIEHLIENYKEEPKILYYELAIMDKLKDEIIKSYENNIKDIDKNSVYKFYHIFLSRTETFTIDELEDLEESDKPFSDNFKVGKTELEESKINTQYFNDLTPLKAKEVLKFKDSPLVTINNYTISDEDRKKVMNEIENVKFKDNFRVSIHQFPLTYQNIEDLYLELLKLNKDDSDLIQEIRKSDYYRLPIRELFKRVKEVR